MNRRDFVLGSCAAGVAVSVRQTWAETPKPVASDYRVIDTHMHLANTRIMGSPDVPKIGYLTLDATVENCIAAMDYGGVQKGFLITYNAQDITSQLRLYKVDPSAARLVYNTKYQKAAWKKHPDRFWWFPDHIDPARETYLEDLQRDFEEGAAGIKLLPIFHGFFPDHPGFMPVYEMCRKHKKPIILDLSYWYLEKMPPLNELEERRNRVKRFSDYARILEPIFRQYADVPISLAHTGTARRESDFDEIFPFIADHPNVSCDIAASNIETGVELSAFIRRLVKAVGAQKVMYGTDWPYWASGKTSYLKGERRWTMIRDNCPDIADADKRLILAGNAEQFLRFELPTKPKA